eukprot:scaffold94393_cov18-Tisochrysis_lutea.AAC.1
MKSALLGLMCEPFARTAFCSVNSLGGGRAFCSIALFGILLSNSLQGSCGASLCGLAHRAHLCWRCMELLGPPSPTSPLLLSTLSPVAVAARINAAAGPLPPGVPPPTIDAASLVQLGEPKYKVTLLPPHCPAPSAAGTAEGAPPPPPPPPPPAQPQGHHLRQPHPDVALPSEQSAQSVHVSSASSPAQTPTQPSTASHEAPSAPLPPAAAEWAEAVAMAASFRRVAAAASGCPPQGPPSSQSSTHAAQDSLIVNTGANQGEALGAVLRVTSAKGNQCLQ